MAVASPNGHHGLVRLVGINNVDKKTENVKHDGRLGTEAAKLERWRSRECNR